MVRFNMDNQPKMRLVTSWISGQAVAFNVNSTFENFMDEVGACFALAAPRVYALQGPGFRWQDRMLLDGDQFKSYKSVSGNFQQSKVSKLYVHDDSSPTTSPGGKNADYDEAASQSSKDSNRSGQTEFNEAILRRDGSKCVFCGSSSPPLEAGHVLPVAQKHLLLDEEVRATFGICSIMDSQNGIALCWACHKCFDAHLVCIDSVSGKLLITNALLANESDKWKELVGKVVPRSSVAWPAQELLKFREDAQSEATAERHRKQDDFPLKCQHCSKGYKRTSALRDHEKACHGTRRTPSMYRTPAGKSGINSDDTGTSDD